MMKRNYKPRVLFVLAAFFLLFFIILVRLYILQIKGEGYFKALATKQYIVNLTTSPNRAKIYDSSGKTPLSFNVPTTSAFIVPNQLEKKSKLIRFLRKNYHKIYKKIKKNKHKSFVWLDRHLSDERAAWLKGFKFKDIHFIEEIKRFYPFPSTSTIIGFTNVDNVGIEGLELFYNNRLRGKPTVYELKKDARRDSFYFDKKVVRQGTKGSPITLTIDSNLQFLAEEEVKKTVNELNAESGSALIINPVNGHIISMVNYPGFDPNNRNLSQPSFTKNRIVTECYEFGSVIKAISALAALEEGVVTPEEMVDCEGKVAYIDKFRVENWKAVETISFKDIIKFSANVGIAKVVKRLGPKFYTHLRRLGFAEKTEINFPGERSGFVNPPENWSNSSLIVMSFGYEIMATILQLGKAFSIIANGGYDIQPMLVKEPKRMVNTVEKKIYSDRAINQVKDILQAIGDKYKSGLEGFRVMGKTGTARMIKNGKYSKKHHIYSFVGIIERDNYKRVIVTFIKKPKGKFQWSSQITAPLFNRIAEKVIINDLTKGKITDYKRVALT